MIVEKVLYSNGFCIFCHKRPSYDDVAELGKFYQTVEFGAHLYCVLTATKLYQKCRSSKEFFGFKFADILKLRKELAIVSCRYCPSPAPPISCKRCGLKFHLPCGIKRSCVTIMTGDFESYCRDCYASVYPELLKVPKGGSCLICTEEFNGELAYTPTCCKADVPLHISCVKNMAYTAGCYTKCPLCNTSEEYKKSIEKIGVFIPQREPTWDDEEDTEFIFQLPTLL